VNPWYALLFVVLIVAATIVGWWRANLLTKAIERARERDLPPAPEPAEPVGIDRLYRENVVVTLKSEQAFSGVLFEHNDREVILRGAHGLRMAADGRDNVPIDGEVLIFTRDIAYMQRP
jgi:hypothetical protein